jgi:hypothetical protein
MRLLTAPNANQKIAKGLKYDHATYILHFSPHTLSGVMNVCPMATIGCIKACLNSAGRGGIYKKGEFTNVIQDARIRKTKLFHSDKVEFFNQLIADVKLAQKQTARMGKKLSIRLNGTSDIVWERKRIPSGESMGMTIFEAFPLVQFYDYTKIIKRVTPSNYHLTFSNADGNSLNVIKAITADMNIAVVFRGALPITWRGLPVISGDDSDLRFLDLPNHIIGLTAKGKAKKDTSGFVV